MKIVISAFRHRILQLYDSLWLEISKFKIYVVSWQNKKHDVKAVNDFILYNVSACWTHLVREWYCQNFCGSKISAMTIYSCSSSMMYYPPQYHSQCSVMHMRNQVLLSNTGETRVQIPSYLLFAGDYLLPPYVCSVGYIQRCTLIRLHLFDYEQTVWLRLAAL